MADTTSHSDPKAIRRTFISDGVINPKRIVKVGGADGKVAEDAATSSIPAGVSCNTSATADGDTVDVVRDGPAEVTFGGAVAPFAFLMTDGSGKAVSWVTGAGVYAIGQNGPFTRAANDVGEIFVRITPAHGA